MDDIFQRTDAYAKARKLTFTKELGAGVHGIVRVAKDNVNFRRFAVKLHRYEDSYRREKRHKNSMAEHRRNSGGEMRASCRHDTSAGEAGEAEPEGGVAGARIEQEAKLPEIP